MTMASTGCCVAITVAAALIGDFRPRWRDRCYPSFLLSPRLRSRQRIRSPSLATLVDVIGLVIYFGVGGTHLERHPCCKENMDTKKWNHEAPLVVPALLGTLAVDRPRLYGHCAFRLRPISAGCQFLAFLGATPGRHRCWADMHFGS